MIHFLEEYMKHFALNIGQALQGLRYFVSHPDIDEAASRGTLRHAALSAGLRSKRVVNDLIFALIPPHWHHTQEELSSMRRTPALRWFQYGYCAWRSTESGEVREELSGVDRRWDPRCQRPAP
jgi:hypothetical protein